MSHAIDHIRGHTSHARKGGPDNVFRYSVDYVLFEPEAELRPPRLMARNSGGVMALHDRDHGGAPKQGRGAAWVRDVMETHGIDLTGPVQLLTQPRVLGHVFNPISFWLLHDAQDRLCCVIAEVSNTFGDRHSYLVHHDDLRPIEASDRMGARKLMHVSPFQPVTGDYEFRFDIRPDRIGIWIDHTNGEGGVIATLTGPRAELSNRAILAALWRRPFGSRRVLGLIHWQAIKLWIKGARFRRCPPPPDVEVSR